jgi:hypothetical protein
MQRLARLLKWEMSVNSEADTIFGARISFWAVTGSSKESLGMDISSCMRAYSLNAHTHYI